MQLIKYHGLIPVAFDIDLLTMAPDHQRLEAVLQERPRVHSLAPAVV